MTALKKTMRFCKVMLATVSLFALLSCGTEYKLNGNDDTPTPSRDISGTIVFNNNSDYNISVHQDNFSGFILVDKDKLPPGASFPIKVYPSSNPLVGSTFSFVYWKKIMRNEDTQNGDVWAKKSVEFNEQESKNIETGKEYTIRIPQPSAARFTESFLKIFNASDVSFNLRNIGYTYAQAGNGEMNVSSGTFGVYKMDNLTGLFIYTGSNYPLPNFTAESGYIYTFEFNGNEVTQTTAEPI